MIPINSSIPAEFPNGKENEIMFFADLIVNNCQKYNSFDLYDVVYGCNLNKEKETQFREIYFEVLALLKLGKIIENENGYGGIFKLTKEGYKAKELGGYFKYVEYLKIEEAKKENPSIIAETYINGNVGVHLSRSEAKKIEIKQKHQPHIKENSNKLNIFSSKLFWQILIPLLFLIIAALLTSDRIMNFINKHINEL